MTDATTHSARILLDSDGAAPTERMLSQLSRSARRLRVAQVGEVVQVWPSPSIRRIRVAQYRTTCASSTSSELRPPSQPLRLSTLRAFTQRPRQAPARHSLSSGQAPPRDGPTSDPPDRLRLRPPPRLAGPVPATSRRDDRRDRRLREQTPTQLPAATGRAPSECLSADAFETGIRQRVRSPRQARSDRIGAPRRYLPVSSPPASGA